MKSTTFIGLCLAGALLQGCLGGAGTGESDAIETDATDAHVTRDNGALVKRGTLPDAKIATLDVPGGQVAFVDEGVTEEGGGIAFWELGDADLSYLLDDRNATALEVFLALAPEGTPAPERLVRHHAEVVARVTGIPGEPRRFALPSFLPEHDSFVNEGLNDGDSDVEKDCWGWAGGSSPYDIHLGNGSFSTSDFQTNFNAQYSQISSTNASGAVQAVQSNGTTLAGTTSAGVERAMAFCLSKAVKIYNDGTPLSEDCAFNQGRALVTVQRTTDAAYAAWSNADSILLTAFGHGGRFRSNYTNSGGGARKYRLSIEWQSLNSEIDNTGCADELVVAWRSKQSSGPGGITN